MPDGQLCLLALPPECCQGEGAEAMQYLKLFCRYITDRKVGVSSTWLSVFYACGHLQTDKKHVLSLSVRAWFQASCW